MLGVQTVDDCVTTYNNMKLKHNHRYIIYSIKDNKTIEIEKQADKSKTYDDFLKELPEEEPRYAVVDVPYDTDDGRPQSKLVFFFWAPDTAKVKPKMVYASSKDILKKKLEGLAKEIQANDVSELAYDNVVTELKRK
ncbi:unnamed protein product [Vitrella brassicaformis CCMP3155]|uniref:ADF-H domain-containing protein n=2 Tax=Vitrella brassicaformis TaxID=1169539 RepID=A0A0G4EGF4_VITBC|nr:unnamed protein product [Vitrella brassicaformis CCMP3155]|mmetsp:Transcript_47524/g.118764  ORF Transcript_47524/g.118764 Transcript_47524/m.118764 type:complete len:137 (+) Transcript_47524:214-624(+)|eukprot:CEL94944.1 unnamed protein product [Vitrella brassicaformis CCMP3155]